MGQLIRAYCNAEGLSDGACEPGLHGEQIHNWQCSVLGKAGGWENMLSRETPLGKLRQ